MTLKKSSHKAWNAMFLQSVKKTCFFPIAAFICLLLFTLSHYSYYADIRVGTLSPIEKMTDFGFWSWLCQSYSTDPQIAAFAFIVAGILNAMILFAFVTSKKQNNVIFSLGMTRTEIYTSRFLAGTLPMLLAIALAAVIDFLIFPVGISGVNKAVCLYALSAVLYLMSIYLLSFSAVAVIISNAGNLIEGTIFTAIIAIFPYTIGWLLFGETFLFLFGSPQYDYDMYQFDLFFQPLLIYRPQYYDGDMFEKFVPTVLKDGTTNIGFGDFFARPLIAIGLALLALAIGIWAFKRRKNEISGSWGKAKNLNIFCGGLFGFYCFALALAAVFDSGMYHHGDGNFATFMLGLICFEVGLLIFHLIFSSKRKASMKFCLKSIPAYAVVMGAVTLIFACGGFGYATKIPEPKEIKEVEIASNLWEYTDQGRNTGSWLGLAHQGVSYDTAYHISPHLSFDTDEEIAQVVELHKAIVDNGKIKNNASDSCQDTIHIIYTLKDGTVIDRLYSESDFELAKQTIKFNDIKSLKDSINDIEMYNETNEDDVGKEDYAIDGEDYIIDDAYFNPYSAFGSKLSFAADTANDVFLFPKDMKNGYCIGKTNAELLEALKKDIIKQSSDRLYFHTPEDEIGVISFGLSYNGLSGEWGYYSEDRYDADGNLIEESYEAGKSYQTNWNIDSADICAVVLTKDMTNTIQYLESKDLMKHFESKVSANDIDSIKVATTKELYRLNRSSISPIFSAAYWTKESVAEVRNRPDNYSIEKDYFGENVNNVITNPTVIQKVLDQSKLFGFCDNSDMVVEIKYTDGSIGTVYISGDAYKQIMK